MNFISSYNSKWIKVDKKFNNNWKGGHSRMIVECSITLGFNIKYLIDINTNLKSNEKYQEYLLNQKNI